MDGGRGRWRWGWAYSHEAVMWGEMHLCTVVHYGALTSVGTI